MSWFVLVFGYGIEGWLSTAEKVPVGEVSSGRQKCLGGMTRGRESLALCSYWIATMVLVRRAVKAVGRKTGRRLPHNLDAICKSNFFLRFGFRRYNFINVVLTRTLDEKSSWLAYAPCVKA